MSEKIILRSFKVDMDWFRDITCPYLHNKDEIEQLNVVISVSLSKENHTRLSAFAKEIGTFLEIVWKNMAQKEKIEKCAWYNEGSKINLSRKARFFLFAGLQDNVVTRLQSALKSRLKRWIEPYEIIQSWIASSQELVGKIKSEKEIDEVIL